MTFSVLDKMPATAPYLPRALFIDEFRADANRRKHAICIVDGKQGWLVDVPASYDDKRVTCEPELPTL